MQPTSLERKVCAYSCSLMLITHSWGPLWRARCVRTGGRMPANDAGNYFFDIIMPRIHRTRNTTREREPSFRLAHV